MLIHEYHLKRGFKPVGSREMPCLCSGWWAVCQGGLGWVPAPTAPGYMFPGGTAASLVRMKCRRDGWSFSEVQLKGGLSDPVHLVKAESPWSKLAVVKLKGMRDRGQGSFCPPHLCAAEGHMSVPYQVMADGQTLLLYSSQETRVIQGSSKLT